ncbi:MAG: bactofilin family protein, partial [Verrucomicrobiales bacterium]
PAPQAAPAPVQPQQAAPVSHAQPAPSSTQGAMRNVLSTDVEINGIVIFNDDLVVDGKIEGEIASTGNLTIGENANIKAEVKTGTIVVYGKVHGNLTATERIDLKASAEVVGDITTKTLSIESGAVFVGKSTVGPSAQAQTKSATPAKPADAPANKPQQSGSTPSQGNPNNSGQKSGTQQGNLKGIKS